MSKAMSLEVFAVLSTYIENFNRLGSTTSCWLKELMLTMLGGVKCEGLPSRLVDLSFDLTEPGELFLEFLERLLSAFLELTNLGDFEAFFT